jgi:broad specificity phosphatase PhoE
MRRLFLVRHGTPDFQRQDVHFYSRTNYALGARGQKDAEYIGERLDKELDETFAFFSSPLRRSHETALPLARRRPSVGGPILVDDLMEISCGIWEGRPLAELEAEYPEAFVLRSQDPSLYTPPEGEPYAKAQERFVAAVEKILDETTERDVVVVAHAMVNMLFLAYAMKRPLTGLSELPQPFGCFNELHVREEKDDQGVVVRSYEIVRLGEKPHDAPDEDQFNRIVSRCLVDDDVQSHSRAVNRLAMALGRAVNDKGEQVNLSVLDAATKLHDIARGERKHSKAGADCLIHAGFPLVAEAISRHQDLPESETKILSASSLLYLADKCCLEDQVVGITERFREVASWDKSPKRNMKLRRREKAARLVLEKVRSVLGDSPSIEDVADCSLD